MNRFPRIAWHAVGVLLIIAVPVGTFHLVRLIATALNGPGVSDFTAQFGATGIVVSICAVTFVSLLEIERRTNPYA